MAPIFRECGIKVELFKTEYAGHARKIVASTDLSETDGIIAIGGDGILYEILNGLRCRGDATRISNVRKNFANWEWGSF